MKRIKLIVSYDGTNYCGWQIQTNGITIEQVLNEALSDLLKEKIKVIGASRTDSGVHALGNVAVFETESRIPADKICFALNQRLPDDIRIQCSEEVPLTWHPRKQNSVKIYQYQILNQKTDIPIYRLYSHFCYYSLDLEKIRTAAGYLVGEHDFKSFCTAKSRAEDTVRTIYGIEIVSEGPLIRITISGNGFLYNMVRIIVGTLIQIGMGMYEPVQISEILAARDRVAAGPTIPAKGLMLVSIKYHQQLQPVIKADNQDWNYELIQLKEDEQQFAGLIIRRCHDERWSQLLKRLFLQADRNGADRIYVIDLEHHRIEPEQQYGNYKIAAMADQTEADARFCPIGTGNTWFEVERLDFIG